MHRFPAIRAALAFTLITLLLQAGPKTPLPAGVQDVLNFITPGELQGDLSFLASDLLQGRYTPSPGLDIAAEFIASKFRAAGLEPGGDQDYFQTAPMVERRLPKAASALTLTGGSQAVTVPMESITVLDSNQASKVEQAPVLFIAAKDVAVLKSLDLTGRAIVVRQPELDGLSDAARMSGYRKARAFDREVRASRALIEISVARQKARSPSARLILPGQQQINVPAISVDSESLWDLLDHPPQGFTASFDVPPPDDRKSMVKNVIAILRGTDPDLKSTCVMLTAHYDHIGTLETGRALSEGKPGREGDTIYNGANDDGSGTVSVIEIARALAKVNPHPKRSIVFMTFFGEERGLLGSQFYGTHPVFPIAKTVADVNLEQVGRTDSTAGKELNNASLTGYDYSTLTSFFEKAGRATGIKIYKDAEGSDAYFTRSDNDALAEQGVPAHTLTVAFDYPDYHGLGDEWQKIDYANMAKVDRMVALGLLNIANSVTPPEWNAANPKTAPFREARQKSLQH